MTRPLSRRALSMITLASLTVFWSSSGCSSSMDNAKDGGSKLSFALSAPGGPDTVASFFLGGMTCYADAVGAGPVKISYAKGAITQQITDVQTFINQGVKVVAVLPFEDNELQQLAAYAKQRNAYIVEIGNQNSKAQGATYNVAEEYGQGAAKLVREKYPNGVKAVILTGPPLSLITRLVDPFVAVAKEHGIDIVGTAEAQSFTVQTGQQVGSDLLTKYPEAKVLFSFAEELAQGAGLAAQQRGVELLTIGQGGTPQSMDALRAGTLSATWSGNFAVQGFDVGLVAERLVKGEDNVKIKAAWSSYTKDTANTFPTPGKTCSDLVAQHKKG